MTAPTVVFQRTLGQAVFGRSGSGWRGPVACRSRRRPSTGDPQGAISASTRLVQVVGSHNPGVPHDAAFWAARRLAGLPALDEKAVEVRWTGGGGVSAHVPTRPADVHADHGLPKMGSDPPAVVFLPGRLTPPQRGKHPVLLSITAGLPIPAGLHVTQCDARYTRFPEDPATPHSGAARFSRRAARFSRLGSRCVVPDRESSGSLGRSRSSSTCSAPRRGAAPKSGCPEPD